MLMAGLHLLSDNYVVIYFSFAMSIIWMVTGFGGLFHFVSIVLAIYYLCNRAKRLSSTGAVLSIISILFPFVLWFILIVFEIVDLRMLP